MCRVSETPRCAQRSCAYARAARSGAAGAAQWRATSAAHHLQHTHAHAHAHAHMPALCRTAQCTRRARTAWVWVVAALCRLLRLITWWRRAVSAAAAAAATATTAAAAAATTAAAAAAIGTAVAVAVTSAVAVAVAVAVTVAVAVAVATAAAWKNRAARSIAGSTRGHVGEWGQRVGGGQGTRTRRIAPGWGSTHCCEMKLRGRTRRRRHRRRHGRTRRRRRSLRRNINRAGQLGWVETNNGALGVARAR